MSTKDFYEILGVSRQASDVEIKAAYRKKAMEFHPDRNPGDATAEHNFKEAAQAYEVLKDPQKRAAYDQYGHAAFQQGGAGAGGPDFGFSGGFADIFESMFGEMAGGGGGQSHRGSDLRYDLEITLEDVLNGKKVEVSITKPSACTPCRGTGAEKGAAPSRCSACQGRGRIRTQQGFFAMERPCLSCQGTGEIIKDPCKTCRGTGQTNTAKKLEITVPQGVEDGTRLRVSGEGEAGFRGAPAGDLYVFLHVRPHQFFERGGADLLCHVPVPMVHAALGGPVEVPTIDGSPVNVDIPAGTQPGDRLRLKGKGLPHFRSSARGDMYVQVKVEIPKKLTAQQRSVLETFDGKPTQDAHPESANFFSRMKEFLDTNKKKAPKKGKKK